MLILRNPPAEIADIVDREYCWVDVAQIALASHMLVFLGGGEETLPLTV